MAKPTIMSIQVWGRELIVIQSQPAMGRILYLLVPQDPLSLVQTLRLSSFLRRSARPQAPKLPISGTRSPTGMMTMMILSLSPSLLQVWVHSTW